MACTALYFPTILTSQNANDHKYKQLSFSVGTEEVMDLINGRITEIYTFMVYEKL
jgi:hypothetical protein